MPSSDKHSRTEDPTPKRKKEAKEKGQVARSPDVASWAGALLGSYLIPWIINLTKGRVLGVLAQATRVGTAPSPQAALGVLQAGLRVVLVTVLPLGAILAVAAIATNIAQTGRSFSFKAAKPRFDHLNPKNGIQRLFSPQAGVQLVKQTLKLLLLSAVSYKVLSGLIREMTGKSPITLVPVLHATASSALGFIRLLALFGLLVGLGDYFFQRHKLKENMKMTKEEVKEESKAADGDPHVKAFVKKRMYAISRSAVLAAVRTADVVVTNPTHYAVALQYDTVRGGAPRVVAKGADLLAARIRTEAATSSIPVVEDPPLARYLYAICDVDEQIPAEIYFAVARLLAFVYSLPAVVRGVGVHHVVPSDVPSEPAAMAELTPSQRERVAAVLSGTGTR